MKAEGKLPDTLTFSGNGEPTGHPEFSEIVDDVLKLRDEYCPKAKVSVLTNAFLITRQPIFDALLKVDNAELKLDTVDEEYIERLIGPMPLCISIRSSKQWNGSETAPSFRRCSFTDLSTASGSITSMKSMSVPGWTQLKRSDRDLSRSIRLTAIPRRMTCRKQRMKSLTRSLNVSGPGPHLPGLVLARPLTPVLTLFRRKRKRSSSNDERFFLCRKNGGTLSHPRHYQ